MLGWGAGENNPAGETCCERLQLEIDSINTTIEDIQSDIITLNTNLDIVIDTTIPNIQDQLDFLNSGRVVPFETTTLLTNANIKSGTAQILVPAVASKIIVPLVIKLRLIYGGSNNFTSSAAFRLFWNGDSSHGFQDLDTNSDFCQASEDSIHFTDISGRNNNHPQSTVVNKDLMGGFLSGLSGNAANNNTMGVYIQYILLDWDN